MATLAELLKNLTPEQQHYIARLVASLPETEGGLNLPLSNTAMQRAEAMGFNTPAYRGTYSNEIETRPDKIFVSSDPKIASTFGGWLDLSNFPTLDYEKLLNQRSGGNVMPLLIKNAEEAKKATLQPNYEMISKTPNVRSRFAAFNPWRKGEADLLASHPLASAGAALAATGGLSGMAKDYLSQPHDPMNQYAQYGLEPPMSRGEALRGTLSAVPGIGEALSGAEGLQAASEGKWGEAGLGALGAAPMLGAIKTYHGSPRAEPFSKFNRDFIRKGVYGEGHYVAENPLESKKYTELKGPMFEGNDPNPQHSIYEVSLEWPGAREATDPLSREHFYQFSLPMNRQPGNIRQIMEEIAAENPETANEYIEFLNRSGSKGWTLSELMKQRPEMLIKYGGFDRLMAGKGIPGVAFRDQVTQNKRAADRTYNYAVFDENIPKIISHNDPGLLKMLWPEYNK